MCVLKLRILCWFSRLCFFNFDYPASLEVELLQEHLSISSEEGEAEVPIYDFTISERAGYETVLATKLIIVDGLFPGSLLEEVADINVFIDVELPLALARRIERDVAERGRTVESVRAQSKEFVLPSYHKHIEKIKTTADIVLSNNLSADHRRNTHQRFTN